MGAEDVIAAALHAAEVEKDTTAAAQRVIDGRSSIAVGGFPAAVVEQSSSRQVAMLDEVGGGGVTDHGALTGLSDNDHPQYALVAAGAFTTAAPTSAVAAAAGTNQLVRQVELDGLAGYTAGLIAAKQGLDATLTALAGLATGANQLAYSTGTDTFSQTDLTSLARDLLDDTTQGDMRTTLGLAALAILATIGTSQIDNDAVTDGKLRNSAALSIIGRSANSTGDPADIAAGTDGHTLRRSGTSLGFGTLAAGAFADNTIAHARLANSASQTLLGRIAGSSGAVTPLASTDPAETDWADDDILWKWDVDGNLGQKSVSRLMTYIGSYFGISPP